MSEVNAMIVGGDLETQLARVRQEFDEVTHVDNSAPMVRRLDDLEAMFGKTQAGDEETLTSIKKRAGFIADDQAEMRLRVQRAFKATDVGRFAFEKGDLERRAEKLAKNCTTLLKDAAAKRIAAENAMTDLGEKQSWWMVVNNLTLREINILNGELAKMGYNVEMRGPYNENLG